jgi:serine/threonine protein phosphatase PrpC
VIFRFVRDRLPEILCADPATLLADPTKSFHEAFLAVNSELHNNPEIDDSMSGTTAIVVLVYGDMLYVANVGDSRAIAGVLRGDDSVFAEDLSSDQTPFR